MANNAVRVRFFNGVHATPFMGWLSPVLEADTIESKSNIKRVRLDFDDEQQPAQIFSHDVCDVSAALGQIKPIIALPDDRRIELLDGTVPTWLGNFAQSKNLLKKIEHSPSLILLSLAFVGLFLVGVILFAIPALSTVIAYQLPAQTLQKVGEESEAQLMLMTKPSTIDAARQSDLRALYAKYIESGQGARVHFREAPIIGANAMALPNGSILVTDELVALSKNDLELVAVMAHERGHLLKRHSLRQALSGLGLSLSIVWLTGDASDFLTSLPTLLTTMKYSRQFEWEADDYAFELMQKQKIPLHYFADILSRLEAQNEIDEVVSEEGKNSTKEAQSSVEKSKAMPHSRWYDSIIELISSHPDTAKRIARFQQ